MPYEYIRVEYLSAGEIIPAVCRFFRTRISFTNRPIHASLFESDRDSLGISFSV
jgi:hypothetical protein